MKDVVDFVMNALPWVAMGLAIAIVSAYSANKEKNHKNKKESE